MSLKTILTAALPRRIAACRTNAILGETSRRAFLGGTAVASCAAIGTLPTGGLFAAGQQRLRIGLVGCGGRGTGAALQAIEADPAVSLVALGDLFADQVTSSAEVLGRRAGDRFDCPPTRWFVGPEAYRDVIASGVDLVVQLLWKSRMVTNDFQANPLRLEVFDFRLQIADKQIKQGGHLLRRAAPILGAEGKHREVLDMLFYASPHNGSQIGRAHQMPHISGLSLIHI